MRWPQAAPQNAVLEVVEELAVVGQGDGQGGFAHAGQAVEGQVVGLSIGLCLPLYGPAAVGFDGLGVALALRCCARYLPRPDTPISLQPSWRARIGKYSLA